jgi:dipeptidyl aminopeptidase/acylaminoacyl peptidase
MHYFMVFKCNNLDNRSFIPLNGIRNIHSYEWAYTNSHILFTHDKNIDENNQICVLDLHTETVKELTKDNGTQSRIIALSPKYPEEIIVAINDRSPKWHDLYRIHIITGEMKILCTNESFLDLFVDNNFQTRIGVKIKPSGNCEQYLLKDGKWQFWDTITNEDFSSNTNFWGFDKTNENIYVTDCRGTDTAGLKKVDLETKESILLSVDPKCDIHNIICHPVKKHPQAVSYIYDRTKWQILDPDIEPDFDYLLNKKNGDMEVLSRSLDNSFWVVKYVSDTLGAFCYLYDQAKCKITNLIMPDMDLVIAPTVKMNSKIIKSRDDLDLLLYYSLPYNSDSICRGIPDKPIPMVVIPHGGPWDRDFWGYDPNHQLLANRGYAVLSVNFRSSTGFGKFFGNAGDLEWGGKIMEDIIDAVNWAISKKIADVDKIAIMGHSFGGYAALSGLTFYPEVFACAIDISGPSNLTTLLKNMPSYWEPIREKQLKRVGDYRTAKGRKLLRKQSPITYANQICRPLLIFHGGQDPRVKQSESNQIIESIQRKKIPVTYAIFPNYGHYLLNINIQESLLINAIIEGFLSKWLGGNYEPIGDEIMDSEITVPVGADEIPGLQEALERKSA